MQLLRKQSVIIFSLVRNNRYVFRKLRIIQIKLFGKTGVNTVSGIIACRIKSISLGDHLPRAVYLILAVRFTEIGIVVEIQSAAVAIGIEIRDLEFSRAFIEIIIDVIEVEHGAVGFIASISRNNLESGIFTDKCTVRFIDAYTFLIRIITSGYTRSYVSYVGINDDISHIKLKRRTLTALRSKIADLTVSFAVIHLHLDSYSLVTTQGILIKLVRIKDDFRKLHLGVIIRPRDLVSRGKEFGECRGSLRIFGIITSRCCVGRSRSGYSG